jgi:hypothetical protein
MSLPLLCCGMAHTLDLRPTGPAQGMCDPLLCVRGIPRLERRAGSALELVRDLTADAFVNVGTHRFRLRVVAQHCAATLPSRRAAGVQASGGFSGAEKATPSSRSSFTRNGVCLFGWKPLEARRGQRPKPSERRRQPQAVRSLCERSKPGGPRQCRLGSRELGLAAPDSSESVTNRSERRSAWIQDCRHDVLASIKLIRDERLPEQTRLPSMS